MNEVMKIFKISNRTFILFYNKDSENSLLDISEVITKNNEEIELVSIDKDTEELVVNYIKDTYQSVM